MLSYVKLPFHFEPDCLKSDLDKILPDEWILHFNKHDYEGKWSGIAFRAIGSDEHNIIPMRMPLMLFGDTPLLEHCPYIRKVLQTLECPQKSVRFLKLHAGSSIREHTDRELEYENGEVRLHVPVLTNPEIEFYLNGERLKMQEGECWYTNVNLPHHIANHSASDRVHLVIDCVVNDWLRTVFEAAQLDR
ncbi:MAG: aspartyl/asparaginyl beta-hydroxylase domain-containing protein [Chloroflexota bacterium]